MYNKANFKLKNLRY